MRTLVLQPCTQSRPTVVPRQVAEYNCESKTVEWRPTVVGVETPQERIRSVRLAMDLTQEAFARQVGVGLKAVQHWESGRRAGPDSRSLAKIASGLGERGGEAALYIAGIVRRPEWIVERLGVANEDVEDDRDRVPETTDPVELLHLKETRAHLEAAAEVVHGKQAARPRSTGSGR